MSEILFLKMLHRVVSLHHNGELAAIEMIDEYERAGHKCPESIIKAFSYPLSYR
jgi:hypothetical protein